MKLATLKDGSRDGLLILVSRDLQRAVVANGIASTLQRALDDWDYLAPQLETLSHELETGRTRDIFPFDPKRCMSPLPRSFQWIDSSSYRSHVERMSKASGGRWGKYDWSVPLVYQGAGDDFIGPTDPVPFADTAGGIDFEAELGVILGDVPWQVSTKEANSYIRLFVLLNDWSLRNLIAPELERYFGFFQSKPSTAFAPIAVTPDELENAWDERHARLQVRIHWNGEEFGNLDSAVEAKWGFNEIIAYATHTRRLRAGTLLGMGTISQSDPTCGFACISEKRAEEINQHGSARTQFMQWNDTVRIEAFDARGRSVFGAIDQTVLSLSEYRKMLRTMPS